MPTLPNRNEEHHSELRDVGMDLENKAVVHNNEEKPNLEDHPLLALLGSKNLESLQKMPLLEELENLLQGTLRWNQFEIEQGATNNGNEGGTSNEEHNSTLGRQQWDLARCSERLILYHVQLELWLY